MPFVQRVACNQGDVLNRHSFGIELSGQRMAERMRADTFGKPDTF